MCKVRSIGLFASSVFLAVGLVVCVDNGVDNGGGGNNNNGGGGGGGGGGGNPTVTSFVDGRDGKSYKKVTIGGKAWMAENLSYNASGSVCYDNAPGNCATYGRLYDWNTALTACPSGWHLPSDAEWDVLVEYVGGSSVAGGKLKSTSGWNYDGNGTDDYGFSALPGGNVISGADFYYVGNVGKWWSATQNDASNAWSRYMYYYEGMYRKIYVKAYLFSVRCVQD